MNYTADGGGAPLTKDELIDLIQGTLDKCRSHAIQGEKLPTVAKSSFGGAETAQVLGFHTGEAHGHVVDAMTQLSSGLLAFDQSVGKFRKDVQDTDETNSIPFLKGMTTVQAFDAGQNCTTGDSPTDFDHNTQCQIPSGDDQ